MSALRPIIALSAIMLLSLLCATLQVQAQFNAMAPQSSWSWSNFGFGEYTGDGSYNYDFKMIKKERISQIKPQRFGFHLPSRLLGRPLRELSDAPQVHIPGPVALPPARIPVLVCLRLALRRGLHLLHLGDAQVLKPRLRLQFLGLAPQPSGFLFLLHRPGLQASDLRQSCRL